MKFIFRNASDFLKLKKIMSGIKTNSKYGSIKETVYFVRKINTNEWFAFWSNAIQAVVCPLEIVDEIKELNQVTFDIEYISSCNCQFEYDKKSDTISKTIYGSIKKEVFKPVKDGRDIQKTDLLDDRPDKNKIHETFIENGFLYSGKKRKLFFYCVIAKYDKLKIAVPLDFYKKAIENGFEYFEFSKETHGESNNLQKSIIFRNGSECFLHCSPSMTN